MPCILYQIERILYHKERTSGRSFHGLMKLDLLKLRLNGQGSTWFSMSID